MASAALGARLVIASQGHHSVIPAIADGLHIEFENVSEAVERIVADASREPFDAIVASDDLTPLDGLVIRHLNQPGSQYSGFYAMYESCWNRADGSEGEP